MSLGIHDQQHDPPGQNSILAALLALLLLLLWLLVIETLQERSQYLRQQQANRQQQWLLQASRSIDARLLQLQREMRLFQQPGDSIARSASTLYPLEDGQLWRIDGSGSSRLRGERLPLRLPEQQAAQQLLSAITSQHLHLLPAATAQQQDHLQLVLRCSPGSACQYAVTGFVSLASLLDSELLQGDPHYSLLDANGNRLASHEQTAHDHAALPRETYRTLTALPLQLGVRFNEQQQMRPFALFALYLVASGMLISALLVLLVLRASRQLAAARQLQSEVSHASQLLTITNNSLRERLRTLSEEQRDRQILIDTVQVGVLLLDAEQHTLLSGNAAAARLLGYTRSALLRLSARELFAEAGQYQQLQSQLKALQHINEREVALQTRNGEAMWSVLSMRPLLFHERKAVALSFVDITERRQHAQRLEQEKQATERALAQLQSTQHELYQRATCDDLTGIANRRHFLSKANQALELSRRDGSPFAVAVLDIDHFKAINDGYGHASGDAVLCAVTASIVAALPQAALLGRMGGEEFAIALPGHTLNEAHALLDTLRTGIASQVLSVEQHALQVTFSAGVAAHSDYHEELSTLLKQADHAMYRAKHAGRNRVESAGKES